MRKRINRFISALESLADSMSRIARSLEDAPVDFTWQDPTPPPTYRPYISPPYWGEQQWWTNPPVITCETGKD